MAPHGFVQILNSKYSMINSNTDNCLCKLHNYIQIQFISPQIYKSIWLKSIIIGQINSKSFKLPWQCGSWAY